MRLWTYTTREILQRPGRALLTLLGVGVALATVVATRLTVPAVHRAYRDLFEGAAGRPALEVTSAGAGGFDPGFAQSLGSLPGVRAVLPRVRRTVSVATGEGNVAVALLGLDLSDPEARAGWPLHAGHLPAAPGEALLDADLARSFGLAPGSTLRVWAPAGAAKLRQIGRAHV